MSTASFDANPSSFAIWCTLIFAIYVLSPAFASQVLSFTLPKILHRLCRQSRYLRPTERRPQRPGKATPAQRPVDAGLVGAAVASPARPQLPRGHLDAVRMPCEPEELGLWAPGATGRAPAHRRLTCHLCARKLRLPPPPPTRPPPEPPMGPWPGLPACAPAPGSAGSRSWCRSAPLRARLP